MQFYSTYSRLEPSLRTFVDFKTALLQGQARDQGLFMPENIPQLSQELIQSLRGKTYAEVALAVLYPYLSESIEKPQLAEILRKAYDFDIPLEQMSPDLLIARMDAGPTASFKDFAARFLAAMFDHFKPKQEKITILVATSGDTGSAIGEAFKEIEGIQVGIVYPKNEVSNIQRKQLTTLGPRVKAIEIEGKFDDCQYFVKQAFADEELKDLHLSSANSINIGRLLPQIVYYFYIWLKATASHEAVNFCIPTGNLGNAMGCILASKMGLPVNKVLIANNENHAIHTWLKSGHYQRISPSINTISNAMNVGNPSNLARLFELYGGMLDKDGNTRISPDIESALHLVQAFTVSDLETIQQIKKKWIDQQVLLEPHGAVGMASIEEYRNLNPADKHLTILIETAHPAKFPEIIEKTLGFSPELPINMQPLLEKEEKFIAMKADYQRFKNLLKELFA